MTNRALVVDDSRTARESLARLLERHALEVCFAETGEEALDFLKHELVDVIFMDHTMPGMDGLEAVSAIKGNPRTATIPVMMYTTKEGEVYVGQARALGAMGVLPKQVQPGVLFDMLLKLGLVSDRRTGEPAPQGDPPRRRITDLADDAGREYDDRALGVSLQTLITRILEEQHLKLRGEILSSHRRFARQVADELREEGISPTPADDPDAAPAPRAPGPPKALTAAALVLLVVAACLGAYAQHLYQSRDAALLEISRMTTASRNEVETLFKRNDGLNAAVRGERENAEQQRGAALEALQWAMNEQGTVPFDLPHFGDAMADRVRDLVSHLEALQFRGRVTLTAHLGQFCLNRDDSGQFVLADPALPAEACEVLGHPIQGSGSVSALQSVTFANEIADGDWANELGIDIELRADEAPSSLPFPTDSAGTWNRGAARNNRVEVTFTESTSHSTVARRP